MKRAELKLGQRYWVFFRLPGYRYAGGKFPDSASHREVLLVDLRTGNKAVVQYDYIGWDRPMWEKGKKQIKKTKLIEISCSQFIATTDDWDNYNKKIRSNHMVIDYSSLVAI